jgi:hypothetical protein
MTDKKKEKSKSGTKAKKSNKAPLKDLSAKKAGRVKGGVRDLLIFN